MAEPWPERPGGAAAESGKHLLLVGMMGAGKTTVGQALAERLGRPYCDSDEQVQRNAGRTVPEIFEQDGEAAFRAEEKKALVQAVAVAEPSVISVAGGAVLDPDNRRLLRESGTVVWLRADVATLARRVGTGEGRPLLGGDPEEAVRRIYRGREEIYEELADVVVDVDHVSPDEAVERILAAVK